MAENLNKLVETALANLKTMADTNTVVGTPIETAGGTTVIPVSKVSVGFTSGGVDYNSKNAPEKQANFGGGTGSGYNITPIAFLVVDTNGNVSLLNIGENAGETNSNLAGTIVGLAEKAPGIIENLLGVFKKNKGAKKDESGDSVILENADLENLDSKEDV